MVHYVVESAMLSLSNLSNGVDYWLTEKPHWPRDFHYDFYSLLTEVNKNQFSEDWLRQYIDILWSWIAIRPKTKAYIFQKSVPLLPKIQKEFSTKNIDKLNLANAEWIEIVKFFSYLFSIKDVASPVFASKMAHFIKPDLFPVIDGDAIGLRFGSYKDYWIYVRDLWSNAKNQAELIGYLEKYIELGRTQGLLNEISITYPYPTKIVELCLIGERIKAGNGSMTTTSDF